MKYKIGFRTIKTALAVSLAILLGQFYELEFYVSSAIITILCVQTTKKKSLKSASSRLAACMLSIPFTYIFFEGFGYNPIMIGALLLFFIPTTVLLKVNEGVVTSTVIILHIYTSTHMTWSVVFNEVGLIIIGVGSALVVNLYMPNLESKLLSRKREVDSKLQHLITEMVEYLRTDKMTWTENEIKEASKAIKEAKALASRYIENSFSRTDNYYYLYFSKREKQMEILERVLSEIAQINTMVVQRYNLADFIESLGSSLQSETNEQNFLEKLKEVEEDFKKDKLPVSWETFEARAQLLLILRELEYYLSIGNQNKKGKRALAYI
ncbi:MAG: aromatic acid exporter family protein [Bacillus sp. (in: firmicutes)]